MHVSVSQRPYSIRTRIKTWTRTRRAHVPCSVRDHIPLEQGLRQSTRTLNQPPVTVRDHIPLEQGLRRLLMSSSVWVSPVCQRPYSIRTRIKTCVFSLSMPKASNVRDHIPLEQGLRQPVTSHEPWVGICQRPYSIRTRIKTTSG